MSSDKLLAESMELLDKSKTKIENVFGISFESVLVNFKEELSQTASNFIESLSFLRKSVSSLDSFKNNEVLHTSIIAGCVLIYALYTLFIGVKGHKTVCLFPFLSFIICCLLSQYNTVIHFKTKFLNDWALKTDSDFRILLERINASTIILTVFIYLILIWFYHVVRFFIFSSLILFSIYLLVPKQADYTVLLLTAGVLAVVFYFIFRIVEKMILCVLFCGIGSTLLILYLVFFGLEDKLRIFVEDCILHMKLDMSNGMSTVWIFFCLIGIITQFSGIFSRKK